MKTRFVLFLLSFLFFILSDALHAQNQNTWKNEQRFALVFGLTQPLVVNGFNAEINYIHNRFIFGYSHGVSLDFSGSLLPDYLKDQGVVVHMPFSTGFGVGYRFTEWLNLRVEPKWHRFEFYYEDEKQTSANRVAVDANNYSVGLGLYGFYQPFKNRENGLRGVTLAPSIRFWPTVSSGFKDNRFIYENSRTGQTEELKSLASGIGFSPLIINLSIGYTFNFRRD